MRRVAAGVVIGLLASSGVPIDSAWACLNGVEIRSKEAVRLISEAETALAAGDAQRVVVMLAPKLDADEGYSISNPKLERRLLRLWAVAQLRTGGTGEIADAIDILRKQLETEKTSPWLKTRLAEALSRNKGGAKEARRLLEDLLRQDLIVDAEGFAVLARLRKQGGDEAGAMQLIERCKSIAKQPAVCSADPLPAPAKTARHEHKDPDSL